MTSEAQRTARFNPNPGFCRTCGVKLASKRFQYCTEHRAEKTPPQKRRKATRISNAAARGGAGAAVLEMVPSSTTAASASTPSVEDWDNGLGKLAVGMTWALGLRMTRGEPRELRGHLALELAMTDDEATAITHPISARFAGTTLNRRHGRKILETLALTEPVVAMMQYADRLHEYRFERARRDSAGPPAPVPYVTAPARPAPSPEENHEHDRPGPVDAAAAAAVPPVTGWTGGFFGHA